MARTGNIVGCGRSRRSDMELLREITAAYLMKGTAREIHVLPDRHEGAPQDRPSVADTVSQPLLPKPKVNRLQATSSRSAVKLSSICLWPLAALITPENAGPDVFFVHVSLCSRVTSRRGFIRPRNCCYPKRRLPFTFFPTISLIMVRVSFAASFGGRDVSETLLTSFVMS